MRRCSITLVLLGLLTGVVTSCGSSSSSSDDSGTGADTATSTQGNTSTTQAANANSSSSATLSSTGTSGSDDGGSGGSSNNGSTTTASTTSVGGGAGNANATSDSTSGGAGEGGSGGDPSVTCPNEPPVADSSCSFVGPLCAYEDCDGPGRTVATCSQGTWFVETGACSETVYCNGGSEMCAPGEVCLIRAGGAFLQECVPNTCEGEAVECDCIEGCYDNCPLFATVETGITITCNTCPSGQCP